MKTNLSRLGFGLSSIAGSGNFSHQEALIKTAIDNGIMHFDVAPYYGSGDAEKILGDILLTCPETVTITTKFGLIPFDGGRGGNLLRSTLRPVFRQFKFLKKAATSIVSRSKASSHPVKKEFEKGALLASIDASIKKLNRPVDIFLLHDADISFARNMDVVHELDLVRNAGKTILTGISGSEETLLDIINWRQQSYSVCQLENSLAHKVNIEKLSVNNTKVITHRAIQGGLKDLNFLIHKRPGFKRIWERETGIDPLNSDLLSQVLLELALNENPNGTVLFSTTSIKRVKSAASALNSPILDKEVSFKIRQLFDGVYITK
jgi:aryl-alcohol dehydrogenase-like predicted oxidoreductase